MASLAHTTTVLGVFHKYHIPCALCGPNLGIAKALSQKRQVDLALSVHPVSGGCPPLSHALQ